MRLHRPKRPWFAPWLVRCAAGCSWYPCPDARPYAGIPAAETLTPMFEARCPDPAVSTPTWPVGPPRVTTGMARGVAQVPPERPLMTPLAGWRARPPYASNEGVW